MLQNLESGYEAVNFGSSRVSVSEVLELLETYELSLDMTESEIHKALVYAAHEGCIVNNEIDLIEVIESAHSALATH